MVTRDTILAEPTPDCASNGSANAVATGMTDLELGPAQTRMASGVRLVSWVSTQEPGMRTKADGGKRASKPKNCRKLRQRVAPD
eukprot:598084-Rhodomonas_salina.1